MHISSPFLSLGIAFHRPMIMTQTLMPLTMLSYAGCSLLILSASLAGASLAEMVFRCPGCTAERQALCPRLNETCAEIVREPGCGCLPRVRPARYRDVRRVHSESQEQREQTSGEAVELLPEQGVSEVPAIRKPSKETTWLGPKESAVRQHRQEMKTKMKTNKVEEVKPARPKQTQCQQELDQILERISKMPFRDNRGPLEDLYALHIPNCDKRGQYNLKQCKMSLHGQRGECWCVNPHTGRTIPSAPTVRGDPNCSQYLRDLELELETPDMAQI
ncbi:hypothetical protein KUCAC02_001040 [Chaenocephalus aceratus]|uniref:Uncharacterized protein n=1 Tax=Chaenocephalus aceratus TaxID=36190 RepID=A0ACB9XWZ8_CHAAC|nr:hypothetical protein KUCAC02_001040 [Chaenocephalus aceratus]